MAKSHPPSHSSSPKHVEPKHAEPAAPPPADPELPEFDEPVSAAPATAVLGTAGVTSPSPDLLPNPTPEAIAAESAPPAPPAAEVAPASFAEVAPASFAEVALPVEVAPPEPVGFFAFAARRLRALRWVPESYETKAEDLRDYFRFEATGAGAVTLSGDHEQDRVRVVEFLKAAVNASYADAPPWGRTFSEMMAQVIQRPDRFDNATVVDVVKEMNELFRDRETLRQHRIREAKAGR